MEALKGVKNVGVKKVLAVRTEVYSRIVGYYRPIQDWNKGKREEFRQRHYLKIGDDKESD
ncbi:hypothetical protein KAW18_10285 [candidate division WOR-3 bacterium]|nr:hypothetical protein [candidate division WOR-3 bacterium]MCK4527746.1 hypothetical protein [candidate division WOR-3 bacterium]